MPLDYPSVGATENLLMAATAAQGTTVIDNAAREPEIVDLAKFLMSMGAHIHGAGTSSITIEGGHELHGAIHEVVADRIEAGTYLLAGVATGGDVTVHGLNPACLELFLQQAARHGRAGRRGRPLHPRPGARGALRPVDVSTLPHPGFATDLQAQFMVALSLAEGTSIVTENVFENRFAVVDELNRLGAGITTSGHHAVVTGPRQLTGSVVEAPDLRGGAALTIAGLVAEGADRGARPAPHRPRLRGVRHQAREPGGRRRAGRRRPPLGAGAPPELSPRRGRPRAPRREG